MSTEHEQFKVVDFDIRGRDYAEINSEIKFDTHTLGLKEKRRAMGSIITYDAQGRFSSESIDKVKHILYEGASVTLVGSLSWNSSNNSFEMKGLYAIIAGGVDEIIEIMEEELSFIKVLKWIFFFASLGCFGVLYLKNRIEGNNLDA